MAAAENLEAPSGPSPSFLKRGKTVTRTIIRLIKLFLKTFTRDIWISRSLPDARQKLWDTRLRIIAIIGVLASAWWAVHSYNTTAERELRKAFWERQVALYFDVTDAASKIATVPPNDARRVHEVEKFWQLYFGSLRLVEDDATVGSAMVSFGRCLTQPGRSRPEMDCDQAILLQKSLTLAVRCRLSLAANWNRKLDGLKGL